MNHLPITGKSLYTAPVSKEIGFGSPDTWRKFSRAYQMARGFFVTQHGSSFGGLCGALARVRRSQVRSSNPHSLPPSFGSEEAGLHTYLEPVMAQIPFELRTSSTKPELTQARLKELLHYDPETGLFTWKTGKRCGRVCSNPDKDGYLRVEIDSKTLKLHRLAFLYMLGSLPVFQVDHIDGCKSNNMWSNLRDVCASTNQQNRRHADATSTVPLLGVSKPRGRTRFSAQIRIGGRTIHLGNFKTELEAHKAYLTKKREIHSGCTL